MKTRILFVMSTLELGGAERTLINMLSELDEKKFDIDLLLMQKHGPLLSLLPPYVNLLDTPQDICFLENNSLSGLLKFFSAKGVWYRSRFILKKKKLPMGTNYLYRQQRWQLCGKRCLSTLSREYDVAVAFMHSDPSYYVIDKVSAKRKYLWIHNGYRALGANLDFDRPYFEQADRIITISQRCVDSLREAFPDLSQKFIWLPNISSISAIQKLSNAEISDAFSEPSAIKILSIGRMTYQKGFDLALAAAAELRRRRVVFRWFFLGAGKLMPELQRQASEFGLNDVVYFLGLKSNPYPYIKNADIIAQTSRYEGKSRVLDEAKMLCRPILATSYQTVWDQIEDGKTGIICEMDSNSIADGLERLISDSSLRVRLSNNLCHMNWECAADIAKYETLFGA